MNVALQNWHSLLPEPWAAMALVLAALAGGALIGWERERSEKPAGLRTMILVSVGAAVFTMLSRTLAGPDADGSRIAAQVVTGIGFLGAGVIMRGGQGVHGVTTAASIWIVAAIGMTCGTGYAVGGIALSGLSLAVLTVATALERRYLGPCTMAEVTLTFDPAGGKTAVQIEEVLDEYRIPVEGRQFADEDAGLRKLRVRYCNAHKHHKEFLARLAALPAVGEIRREGAI
jgi:putative Mg2+ transporter-C (MgtC) family protein